MRRHSGSRLSSWRTGSVRRAGFGERVVPTHEAEIAPLIVHVIYRLDFGGLENGLVNIVNRMPAERYRMRSSVSPALAPRFRQRIQRTTLRWFRWTSGPAKTCRLRANVANSCDACARTIVHTRNLGTVDMQWVAAACGVRRRVHGEHGWEATDPRGTQPREPADPPGLPSCHPPLRADVAGPCALARARRGREPSRAYVRSTTASTRRGSGPGPG